MAIGGDVNGFRPLHALLLLFIACHIEPGDEFLILSRANGQDVKALATLCSHVSVHVDIGRSALSPYDQSHAPLLVRCVQVAFQSPSVVASK